MTALPPPRTSTSPWTRRLLALAAGCAVSAPALAAAPEGAPAMPAGAPAVEAGPAAVETPAAETQGAMMATPLVTDGKTTKTTDDEVAIESAAFPAKALELDAGYLDKERATLDALVTAREALRADTRDVAVHGARGIKEISLREAVFKALERNLSIKQSRLSKQIARTAIEEAQAVFDPTLTLSFSASRVSNFQRIEYLNRHKGETISTGSNPNGAPNNYVYFNSPLVQAIQYDTYRPEGFYRTKTIANEGDKYGAVETFVGSGTLSQLLPWGGSLSLTVGTTFKESFYGLNTAAPTIAIYDAYGKDWTSNISASFSFPLPYTQDFGRRNSYNTAIDVAQKAAEAAVISVESTINDTLLQVELGYWSLVDAILRMEAAVETRKVSEDLLQRTTRLAERSLITAADEAQIVAQVEAIRGNEESSFNDFVTASNALHQLLDMDQEVFLVPIGYLRMLDETPAMDDADGIENNPQYLTTLVNIKTASVIRRAREAEARPDITLNGSVAYAQSNAVFGYERVTDSWAHLLNPDSITLSASLAYNATIGDQAEDARIAQATVDESRREIARQSMRNTLLQEVEAARLARDSAAAQITLARRNVDLAEAVYDRAVRYQQARRITEYEIAEKLADLLAARTSLAQARVGMKTAEAQFLSAVGLLADRYPNRTAQTDGDRSRLAALEEHKVLRFFGGGILWD